MTRFQKLLPPPPQHDIVLDTTTGLQWQAQPFTDRMTFAEAEKACAELRLGGYSDWRLPTRVELMSLVDDTRHNPAIDTDAFPGTPSALFWSCTPYVASPSEYAWFVGFGHGLSNFSNRDNRLRVRAVRGASRQ